MSDPDLRALARLRKVVIQHAKTLDGLPAELAASLSAAAARKRAAAERRRCRRVPVCLPIRYRSQSELASTVASVSDLSKGGLFVRAAKPMLVGEVVAGAFTIHGKERSFLVKFRGTVAWTSGPDAAYPPGPGIGVGFNKVRVSILPQGSRPFVDSYRGRARARHQARARARQLQP